VEKVENKSDDDEGDDTNTFSLLSGRGPGTFLESAAAATVPSGPAIRREAFQPDGNLKKLLHCKEAAWRRLLSRKISPIRSSPC
jgi:hypothetical protein